MPSQTKSLTDGAASKYASSFLPDFCQIRALLIIVIIAELLAFVLTLAPLSNSTQRWSNLGLISLFVQWIALSSTAILCLCKPWFGHHKVAATVIISLAIILGMTCLVSLVTYHWILSDAQWPIANLTSELGFVLRNSAIALIISIVALRYFYVQHQSRLSIQAEARANLNALQARIQPHFLFNSMNTIASLTGSDPELAETVVEDLADLFRDSLSEHENNRSLEQEITLAKRYLRIEQLRLGSRLEIDWDIDALPNDALVPALLIQPLVENAVYHGIEPRSQGGCIEIRGQFDQKTLLLTISNPLPDNSDKSKKGSGIALENTEQRLAGWYEGEAQLQIYQDDQYFKVSLSLPYERVNSS